MTVTRRQLLAFRARRQRLAPDARGRTSEDVLVILTALQPFPPISGTMPGSAPHPRSRVVKYEDQWSQKWRAEGRLVKGRFMNGNVAYVAHVDLGLYAAAFRRPLRDPLPRSAACIRDKLEQYGPLPKSGLRELCSIERGRFDRALLALNQAFVVMEVQRDVDWDSPWDLRKRAYPHGGPDAWDQLDAQAEVLRRFTSVFGSATAVEMADWSGWSRRQVHGLIATLVMSHDVVPIEIEGQVEPAYLASDDAASPAAIAPIEPFIVVLPPNDPFVLPQRSLMRDQFRPYALPYCYGVVTVDGQIAGAAWGEYRRRFIHIEELSLQPALVRDPPRMDEVLTALTDYLGAGQVPIHIYGINGEAEAPWICEIFERHGFVRRAGYYVR